MTLPDVVIDLGPWLRAASLGLGATLIMDAYAMMIKRLWGTPSLNYSLVGRWILYGVGLDWRGDPISLKPARTGETPLGWSAHYAIGASLGIGFITLVGADWLERPTPWPALLMGAASTLAPFLILQPALGAGLAARRTPRPWQARWRSLMAHLSFGLGLYLCALLLRQV